MSKAKVIVDTSVVIDHLRDLSDNFKKLNEAYIDGNIDLLIPTIVVGELFSGKKITNTKEIRNLENTIDGIDICSLGYTSSKLAGQLIRKYKQIPDPFDLLIAAITIERNAQLATLNKKHFREIKEVKLFDLSLLS